MKKILAAAFCLALSPAFAQETLGNARSSKGGPFGLGMMLGDPLAISAKYFLSGATAIDLGVGYGYSGGDDGFQIQSDYLIHPHVFTRTDEFLASWFVGVGGALILSNDPDITARVPLGINFTFMEVPIETFLEFAPGLELVDDLGFAFDGAIGARYYF